MKENVVPCLMETSWEKGAMRGVDHIVSDGHQPCCPSSAWQTALHHDDDLSCYSEKIK